MTALGRTPAAVLVALAFFLTVSLLLQGCGPASTTVITATPSPGVGLINESPLCRGVHLSADRQLKYLAVYSWQPHDNSYRPAPTKLTGSLADSSRIAPLSQIERIQGDFPNDNYVVLQYIGDGASLLRSVTQTASAAIQVGQSVPPEGHMGIFLGLTDSDIAAWPSVEQALMQPVSSGGKLVSNPVVLESITSGQLMIFVGSDLETGCSLTATNR
jgi:hypothetical protein